MLFQMHKRRVTKTNTTVEISNKLIGSEDEKYLHDSCPSTKDADIKHQQKIAMSSNCRKYDQALFYSTTVETSNLPFCLCCLNRRDKGLGQ
jgi:hypothetical protein